MIKKFKELSPTMKGFIVLGIILIIGIILRWSTIKEEVKRGFGFFSKNDESIEQVENNQDSIN
ncbi:MAG: hypothetical protein LBG19_04540 [Prevotellaceae bacterium]|jgi:hypothetical protein|nr:hypothetical protein [Prevotellaceae bacterium]